MKGWAVASACRNYADSKRLGQRHSIPIWRSFTRRKKHKDLSVKAEGRRTPRGP